MSRFSTEGKCGYCGKLFSGSAMGRHMTACGERKKKLAAGQGRAPVFLLKASAGPYWIFLDIDGSATLEDLDSFLRDIWLECCGHMSCFKIGDSSFYNEDSPDLEGSDMKVRLAKVLKPGVAFEHEYDFGTTTKLQLKVIDLRSGKVKSRIDLASRNSPPEFKCASCGNTATDICAQCIWEKEPWYCKPCAKKHECGDDMFLPIVNSPRTGMCGYTG